MPSPVRAQLFIAALPGYDPALLESVTPQWAAGQIREAAGDREIKNIMHATQGIEIKVVPGNMVFGDEPNGGERMGVVFFKAKNSHPETDVVIMQIARVLLNRLRQNDATLIFPDAPDAGVLQAISKGALSKEGPAAARGAQVSYEDSGDYTQGFKVRIKDAQSKLSGTDTTELARQWQQATSAYFTAHGKASSPSYPVCNVHFEGHDLVLEGNRKTKEGNVEDWKKMVSGTCQQFAKKLPLGDIVPDFYTPGVIVDLTHSELHRSQEGAPISSSWSEEAARKKADTKGQSQHR